MFTKEQFIEISNNQWKDAGCVATHKACDASCSHIDDCMRIATLTATKAVLERSCKNIDEQIAAIGLKIAAAELEARNELKAEG